MTSWPTPRTAAEAPRLRLCEQSLRAALPWALSRRSSERNRMALGSKASSHSVAQRGLAHPAASGRAPTRLPRPLASALALAGRAGAWAGAALRYARGVRRLPPGVRHPGSTQCAPQV